MLSTICRKPTNQDAQIPRSQRSQRPLGPLAKAKEVDKENEKENNCRNHRSDRSLRIERFCQQDTTRKTNGLSGST